MKLEEIYETSGKGFRFEKCSLFLQGGGVSGSKSNTASREDNPGVFLK